MRCVHLPYCGGCQLQQMPYQEQLAHKQALVAGAFAALPLHLIQPILAAPEIWEYRNKMEFSFSEDLKGEKFLGLVMRRSRGHVFHLTECHLCSPWFANVVQAVREWWGSSPLHAYKRSRDAGHLRCLTLREAKRGPGKLVYLTVSGNPEFPIRRQQLAEYIAAVQSATPLEEQPHLALFLRIQQIAKGAVTQFYEMHLAGPDHMVERLEIPMDAQIRPFAFKVSPTSFFQPNSSGSELLYRTALEMVASPCLPFVLDLYCGTATLALLFAARAQRVIAIDSNPQAILDAEVNRALNGASHLELYCGDVGEQLRALDLPTPDLIVVDPPRAGLDALALQQLVQLHPKQILYISCNPHTAANNLTTLLSEGYELTQLQPIDTFPHTLHVETVSHLVRMRNAPQ